MTMIDTPAGLDGHPHEEALVAHAVGQTTSGERVLLEAHLAFCASCRATVAELLEPGGTALERLTPAPAPPAPWTRLLERIAAEPRPATAAGDLDPLPAAVRSELAAAADRPAPWRPIALSGARWRLLHREEDGRAAVFLIHTRAGRRFPEHRHLGREDLVVLTGAFVEDAGGRGGPGGRGRARRAAAGDFRTYAPGSSHAPQVEPAEDCWLVTRVERGVRFTGWRGLAQGIGGMSRARSSRSAETA